MTLAHELKELIGAVPAHAARKQLRRWKQRFNEEDIEDIVSEAWLELHSDEGILREELEKEGLKWNAENLQRVHVLIDQRMRDTRPSALGARQAADRWKDQLRSSAEVSTHAVVGASEDGGELLLKEALGPSTAVVSRSGIVLNSQCTPDQFEEELRHPTRFADREAMLLPMREVLNSAEIEWLLHYYRTQKTKTGAERSKCFRLLKKAKARLQPVTRFPL